MKLLAAHALLPDGWASDVLLEIGPLGRIEAVRAQAPPGADIERIAGFVVPGMANLHSHAFQRAMAGHTEARSDPSDSFWTWRELMYRFAARITPEQMHDVAAYLYVEMLRAGFTAVAEFHYLHHDSGGAPYADAAEMSHRLVAAAREAGTAMTLLPVLYMHSGFGGRPPSPAQSRFVLPPEAYQTLVGSLYARHAGDDGVRVGVAFHSLRAVCAAAIADTCATIPRIDATMPVHIHIAEQRREIEECLAWSGRRPVQWLLDHAPVTPRWCLVHATHLDAGERQRLATSGAIAGVCPVTEANLGDGLFPAREYLDAGGALGIGTDSHVQVDVAAELRLLEYGQRLATGRRAVLATGQQPSPGERLFATAAAGGAAALGIDGGRIAPGARADLVVLDPESPPLWNKGPREALDAWIFTGGAGCVRDVMVGGTWRIRERRHPGEARLAARFRAAQAALLS